MVFQYALSQDSVAIRWEALSVDVHLEQKQMLSVENVKVCKNSLFKTSH